MEDQLPIGPWKVRLQSSFDQRKIDGLELSLNGPRLTLFGKQTRREIDFRKGNWKIKFTADHLGLLNEINREELTVTADPPEHGEARFLVEVKAIWTNNRFSRSNTGPPPRKKMPSLEVRCLDCKAVLPVNSANLHKCSAKPDADVKANGNGKPRKKGLQPAKSSDSSEEVATADAVAARARRDSQSSMSENVVSAVSELSLDDSDLTMPDSDTSLPLSRSVDADGESGCRMSSECGSECAST